MWMRGAALAVTALISACGTPNWPKTAEEYRRVVADSSFAVRKTFTVQRSFSDVNASLRAATQKCLNGTQHKSTSMPGLFGGPTAESRQIAYNSTFNATGNRGELTARLYYPVRPSAFGFPEGGQIFYLVDTAPQGKGTALAIYGNALIGDELETTVREWASGGPIRCPKLPG
jgi:hypothetical protein